MAAAQGGAGSGSASVLLSHVLNLLDGRVGFASLILSGGIGSGKTRAAEGLVLELAHRGIRVGGVLCPRLMQGETETIGYRVRDLATGEERPFANLGPPGTPVGRFFVPGGGLTFACAAVERGAREARVVLADEVGRWELAGGGLAPAVRTLLASPALSVLLVRDTLVEAVVEAFGINVFEILPVEGAR